MNYSKILIFSLLIYLLFNKIEVYSQCIIHEPDTERTASFVSIDDDGPSSYDEAEVNINGTLFFGASDGYTGSELWKIDGTTNELVLVKDIVPGRAGSNPTDFTSLNDKLMFKATTSDLGTELWVSDGTEAGTFMLKDIWHGSQGSDPGSFEVNDNVMYFDASDSIVGRALWRTDGTKAGTMLVKDVNPNITHAPIGFIKACDSTTYFRGNTTSVGQLWKTDGTELGTNIVKVFDPGPGIIIALHDCYGNDVYFSVNGGLWKSDGTESGTTELNSDLSITGAASLGENIILAVKEQNRDKSIWISDGTLSGTQLLKVIEEGNSNIGISDFVVYNAKLYFTVSGHSDRIVLWETDGTTIGTKPFKEIYGFYPSTNPSNVISYGGYLFFSAHDNLFGEELWRSDGTTEGTVRVSDIAEGTSSSFPTEFVGAGDFVYFKADDLIHGFEMWRYNLADMTVELFRDICTSSFDSYFSAFYCDEEELYYIQGEYGAARGIWKTDGTVSGTTAALVNQGDLESVATLIGKIGNDYYFVGTDGIHGYELWKSDGTEAGTSLVKDIYVGSNNSDIRYAFINGDNIYFNADDGIHGKELWMSDGTAEGTFLINDISPGISDSNPRNFVSEGAFVYFNSNIGLWLTDGTPGVTIKLSDSGGGGLTALGSRLLFIRSEVATGKEVWVSDGSYFGTHILKDITVGPYGSDPSNIAVLGDVAYFIVRPPFNPYQLWKTDGTTNGTQFVTTNIGLNPSNLMVSSDRLFFRSVTANGINSLWVSDGTEEGTMAVLDIGENYNFHLTSSTTSSFVYFIINGSEGREFWRSDGTIAGSYKVSSLPQDVLSNTVSSMKICNDDLYFIGSTAYSYKALYKLNCSKPECNSTNVNIWDGPMTGEWHKTPVYWGEGRIPSACDDVIIPSGYDVSVQAGKPAVSHTLDVKEGAIFNTVISAELNVNN